MLRHLAPFLIGAVVGWMIFIFTLSENTNFNWFDFFGDVGYSLMYS